MNNGTAQPAPTFWVQFNPATNQLAADSNIIDSNVLLQVVGQGLAAIGRQRCEPPKPKLAIAQEIPRMNGPLRNE